MLIRKRSSLLVALLLLLLPALAGAAVIDGVHVTTGAFTTTAQAATGPSVNTVRVTRVKYRAMVVSIWNTAGTATAQLEIQCIATAPWAVVANSSSALTVSGVALDVVYPMCDYRVNVTACSGCAVNAQFSAGADLQ